MTPPPTLLTTSEVAERASVHPATVRRWVDDGLLAAITLPSGLLRYRAQDVDDLLTPATRPPADPGTAVAS